MRGVIYAAAAKMPIRGEKRAADFLSDINLVARQFTAILYNGAAAAVGVVGD